LRDRLPSVSGSFYEEDPSALQKQLEWCFLHKVGPGALPRTPPAAAERKILAIVSPHAGYVYSGPVAAHGYYLVSGEPAPGVVVILGPNHTGAGAGVSVWDGGEWVTPLGKVAVERDLARSLAGTGSAEADTEAHLYEHSLEVQIPFLQYAYRGRDFKILPVCMMLQDYVTSLELGRALAGLLKGRAALIVASTDFSHYVPYSVAYRKDALVGDAIVKMDARGIGDAVIRENVSMCGPGPVMAAIVAALELGARSCSRLCYATSGDTYGPKDQVVGYGSFAVSR